MNDSYQLIYSNFKNSDWENYSNYKEDLTKYFKENNLPKLIKN